jgi:hypothetical protein
MRILIEYLVPLLLPTLIYLVWRLASIQTARPAAAGWSILKEGPWFWLIISGFALAAACLVIGALLGGYDPSGTYIAPRWEGGQVVPGRVE